DSPVVSFGPRGRPTFRSARPSGWRGTTWAAWPAWATSRWPPGNYAGPTSPRFRMRRPPRHLPPGAWQQPTPDQRAFGKKGDRTLGFGSPGPFFPGGTSRKKFPLRNFSFSWGLIYLPVQIARVDRGGVSRRHFRRTPAQRSGGEYQVDPDKANQGEEDGARPPDRPGCAWP